MSLYKELKLREGWTMKVYEDEKLSYYDKETRVGILSYITAWRSDILYQQQVKYWLNKYPWIIDYLE